MACTLCAAENATEVSWPESPAHTAPMGVSSTPLWLATLLSSFQISLRISSDAMPLA